MSIILVIGLFITCAVLDRRHGLGVHTGHGRVIPFPPTQSNATAGDPPQRLAA
jgi:hypothetical protein